MDLSAIFNGDVRSLNRITYIELSSPLPLGILFQVIVQYGLNCRRIGLWWKKKTIGEAFYRHPGKRTRLPLWCQTLDEAGRGYIICVYMYVCFLYF